MTESNQLVETMIIQVGGFKSVKMSDASAYNYRGTWVYGYDKEEIEKLIVKVDLSFGDSGTNAQQENCYRHFIDGNSFDDSMYPTIEEEMKKLTENEAIVSDETADMFPNIAIEILEEKTEKKTRARKQKNPLNEMLPMVFNAKGNVRKHPTNPKVKTADIRDTIRKAAKISNMSSVMIVLPCGVLHLGTGFYDLCYGPTGLPIFDLIVEDLMLNGWVMRGLDLKPDTSIPNSSITINE